MPRQSQPTRKSKSGKPKQQSVGKKASKDDSSIIDPQDRPNKRNKKDFTTELQDNASQPPTNEEKQGRLGSKRQTKSKISTGILSTQDSNVQSRDTNQMTRRRSSRVVATKKGKPSYFEASSSTTEDDDSDDESDVSLASLPKSKYKDVATGDKEKRSIPRGKNPAKTSLHRQRSPNKSPKKKARVVSTAGTPLYAGVDIKKPSPASSSIKEITRDMWKENEGDWRVESAMDY